METIDKALDILEIFLKGESRIGLKMLADLAGLNISTAHRICSTLVERGYLKQEQKRGKYSLGLKLLEFSNIVRKSLEIRQVAMRFLRELNREVDECVNLAVLDGNETVYVEHIENSHGLTIFTQVGRRVPLHCTGVGKVFLAHMKEDEREKLLGNRELPSHTAKTITDPSKLKQNLLVVKQEGVAEDDEETEVGARCVASPIRDCDGNVVAALSVSGPSSRLTSERVEALRSLVKKFALEISRAAGYSDK